MQLLPVFGIIFVAVIVLVVAHFLGNLLYIMDERGLTSSWWIGVQVALDDIIEIYYRKPRNAFWRWRCKCAWQYLLKHDSAFRHREAKIELDRRKKSYFAEGGNPNSPECPDIWKILKDWGFSE